jgi:hypothetical protein
MPSTLKARPLAELKEGGCLAGAPGTPQYTLSAADRADLVAGIASVKQLLLASPVRAPLDRSHLLVGALGCRNCHLKDEAGGPPDPIKIYFRTADDAELGDEGRLPPRLTGAGYKLRAEWIKKVLTEGGRARPYMSTRMPQFGAAHVGNLNTMLAASEGIVAGADAPGPKSTDELTLAGRRLVGEAGLNCISCHTYAGKTAGTAGPEMTEFAGRIRYEWWKPYILAPARFKPGTRMTAFFEDGRGKIADVFGGDPDRQIDALWSYFAAGKAAPAPEGPADIRRAAGQDRGEARGVPLLHERWRKSRHRCGLSDRHPFRLRRRPGAARGCLGGRFHRRDQHLEGPRRANRRWARASKSGPPPRVQR